jgi:hypothetical protein
MPSRVDLFMAKVAIDPVTRCWIWTAHINKVTGYGQFWDGEKVVGAHVFSYVNFKGPLIDGLEPDHTCRVRKCVCPDHLEAVTRQVNLLRGDTIPARNAAKIRCDRGHELFGENLYQARNGSRQCRLCRAARYSEWASSNRERRRQIDRDSYRRRTERSA